MRVRMRGGGLVHKYIYGDVRIAIKNYNIIKLNDDNFTNRTKR